MIWYLFGLACVGIGALLVLVAYCWQIAGHLKAIRVLMLECKIRELQGPVQRPAPPRNWPRGSGGGAA